MKVVIAIDSFKGCMTTNEVSQAVEEGIKEVYSEVEIVKVPIADGGEGTVDTLIEGLGGRIIHKTVRGPLGELVNSHYGILPDGTAVIEMAAAAGLPLIPESKRNPLMTTTYGVGELIKDAIKQGCREFIIGIGGSATNDAGCGMLQALGFEFYDKNQQLLEGIGQSLNLIHSIEDRNRLKELDDCQFLIACDVDNPFYGPNGAAYVYARQKGANDAMIEELDQGLKNISRVIQSTYQVDVSHLSGAGAAGGLGGGIHAFLNGRLMPGVDIIFKHIGLEDTLKDADLVITGEGKMDFQSVMGKVPTGVARLAKQYKKPVIAIAGHISEEAYQMNELGITSIISIMNYPMSLEEAMKKEKALSLVKHNIKQIFLLIKQVKQ